jgi:hypothetical protein
MNELDLYKFIRENEIEHDWIGDCLYAWVPFNRMEQLTEMVGYSYFDDGVEVGWHPEGNVIDLVEICGYFGIDPERISKKND